MKKRVITKQSLEELEKVMPIVSELEMRAMVGGVQFRDASGAVIAKVGSSDIVRVILDYHANSEYYNSMSEDNALKTGKGLSDLSQTEINVFARMAGATMDIPGYVAFKYATNSTEISILGSDDAAVSSLAPTVLFSSKSLNNYTFNDFTSLIRHEMTHVNRLHITGATGFNSLDFEIEAVSVQVNSPEWKYASYEFKLKTARVLVNAGMSREKAASFCGVTASDI